MRAVLSLVCIVMMGMADALPTGEGRGQLSSPYYFWPNHVYWYVNLERTLLLTHTHTHTHVPIVEVVADFKAVWHSRKWVNKIPVKIGPNTNTFQDTGDVCGRISMKASVPVVWRMKTTLLYYIQEVQSLSLPGHCARMVVFQWLLVVCFVDPRSVAYILFY